MEPLTQQRFLANVVCSLRGCEVQNLEVSRSFAQNTPHLETLQSPHVDFFHWQNNVMGKTTRQNIADRLDYLIKVSPDLSTNVKVAARARVGENTVRRLRLNEDIDVSISNVEAVAQAFGISLAEFVSPPGRNNGLDADELVLLHKYRQLDQRKDKDEVLFFASSKAAIRRLQDDDVPD